MDIVGAIIALGSLVTFITEVAKRIPVKLTDGNPKYIAVAVAVLLIGGYGYINGDGYDVVAQQVIIATPLSYVIYDVARGVYGRVKAMIKK